MSNFAKGVLSGSVNGRPIRIAGATTVSGGTLIHTALSATGSNQADEIWIWASNGLTATAQVTLRFGALSGTDQWQFSVPPRDGLFLISPGLILNGALVCRAHSTVSNAINLVGYVNSVTT